MSQSSLRRGALTVTAVLSALGAAVGFADKSIQLLQLIHLLAR